MRIGSRAFTAGGLAFAAALVVGCGTSQIKGALSESANSTISGDLSAVSDAVSDGSCPKAQSALAMLDTTLSQLPSDTNVKLVKNLRQGASTVRGLAVKECHGTSPSTSNSSSSSSTTNSSTTPATSSTTPTTSSDTTPQVTTTQSQPTSQSQSTPGTGSVTSFQSTTSGTSSNGGAGLSGGQ